MAATPEIRSAEDAKAIWFGGHGWLVDGGVFAVGKRVNNRKGSLMRTPDVTCQCGHRNTSHGWSETGIPACEFCECQGFEPRDRSIPSQPVKFPGTAARVPFGPRQVARRNEDAS